MPRLLGWLCLVAFAVVLGSPRSVQAQVAWRQDYASARREAQQQGKPMLLDFGTVNCSWCVKLDQTTFRDPQVQKLLNELFIPVKIDANQNMSLTQRLGITSYPTLVLAKADGEIMGSHPGYQDAVAMRSMLQSALASNPPRQSSPTPRPVEIASKPISLQPSVLQPISLSIAPPEPESNERQRAARELLQQAHSNFEAKQYAACLECCAELSERFTDLTEASEAIRLRQAISGNLDAVRSASDQLARRLGDLYLSQAEVLLRSKQSRQAEACLQRVIQVCPEAPCAQTARTQLNQIQQMLASPKIRAQNE